MRKSWLMCVLLGSLAWGQTPPAAPSPAQASQAPGNPAAAQAPPAAPVDKSVSVPPDAPVLTIKGVCPPAKTTTAASSKTASDKTGAEKIAGQASKTSAADCKTVITKAEFERLANGLAPNVTPQLKHQLAAVYPRLLAMSQAAEKKGLENSPRFKETMRFAKMQILTNELQRDIQEEAAKVPEQDIADYYKKNPEAYEQYNLDRLFVPRLKQAEADAKENDGDEKDEKLTPEQQKAKEEQDKAKEAQGEQEMTKLAESLRARAAAGEDFTKLEKEAFEAGGMKVESPTINLPKIRRTGLPPAHAAVFDLKPGEVSQVISDTGGHYIYKVNSKDQVPQDQVNDEIKATLQNQRTRDAMDKYQNSFQVETNETYFGPPGPAGPAGMRPGPPSPHSAPRPKLAPSPTAPQAQPQAPPPGSKPN
jgi:parvulin-like peptidyl-prolyl isomerase